MKTLKITAKDIKKSTSYWSNYIGKEDLSNFDGNVEIDNNLGWVRFDSISVTGHLLAGSGTGIVAGLGIVAGDGIQAGLSITCKENLNVGYRIFAGTATWIENISDEDKTITCGKLEHGEIEYGILKETGLPEEELDIIELNGKKYREIKEEL